MNLLITSLFVYFVIASHEKIVFPGEVQLVVTSYLYFFLMI